MRDKSMHQCRAKPHLTGVVVWNLIEIPLQLLLLLPEIPPQILIVDVFHLPTQKNFSAVIRYTSTKKWAMNGLSGELGVIHEVDNARWRLVQIWMVN